jgi:type IV secretory pathway VirJ component
VIGYSQGADVLPFALNRLGRPARRIVWRVVLLGIGRSASFEFHLGNWIGMGGAGIPILPEALRLSGENTICIYGESDDTLCPQLDPRHARAIALPGGHHFDGDYARLAALILGSTEPNPAALGGTRAPLGPPARAAPPRPPADLRR